MATGWPKKPRLLGKRFSRIDGPDKSTGRAKYSFDISRPGMLHAMILRCPYPHAKIKSIDTSAAEKMPGFKGMHIIKKEGEELYHAGDEVLGIACDTEEHCADALRAVKIEYERLDFVVKEEDGLKMPGKKTVAGGPQVRVHADNTKLDPKGGFKAIDDAFKACEAVVEGSYGVPVIMHQCLESHGLVAEWQDGVLTVWASTQAVFGTADALAKHFTGRGVDLPLAKVRCITHYMGGGFGSKFGPDIQGIVAAELALKAKAPVKLMLDRGEEAVVGGNRPSAFGTGRMGGMKDGTILVYESDSYGTGGISNSPTTGPLPYVYEVPSSHVKHTVVRTNGATQRAMRAPGHPQSCFLTDCILDDFAAKIGMDPLAVRLKNIPANVAAAITADPISLPAIRGDLYRKQLEIAAELSKWKEKWHPPGSDKGPIKRGIGMALHTWGGQAAPQRNECTLIISRDGSVLARSSTQDLGTAQRTVTALVAAEIFGLEPKDITVEIGESNMGDSSGSGGSTTCPSQAPATLRAAYAALDDFFTKIAPKLGSEATDLTIEPGKVVDKKRDKSWTWKEARAKLGMAQAKGIGFWTFAEAQKKENAGISKTGVCGVQVAEVVVDTETGVVRCVRIVAVQDCGLLINKQGCESQVAGGVIMGLNYALFEERVMDRVTGRQCNADMEFYKLGGIEDMPEIVVHMMDMPERGVIGIGEPPTISTHAAIGNALFNALGVRVPQTPFTPERVLAALAQKGGK